MYRRGYQNGSIRVAAWDAVGTATRAGIMGSAIESEKPDGTGDIHACGGSDRIIARIYQEDTKDAEE
jgi:hypothetical protein